MTEKELKPNFPNEGFSGTNPACPSYFKLFENQQISLRQIKLENPYFVYAIEALIKKGKLCGVGIYTPDNEMDILMWLPDPKDKTPRLEVTRLLPNYAEQD